MCVIGLVARLTIYNFKSFGRKKGMPGGITPEIMPSKGSSHGE